MAENGPPHSPGATARPVRIGVVGADLGVMAVQEAAANVPALEVVPLAYELEDEAAELIAAAARRIDVALFCGPVPYQLARGAIPAALPVTYIPYDGSGLVKALFDFYRLPQEGPSAFSIDSVPRETVLRGVHEVELTGVDVVAISDGTVLPREQLVERHRELWQQGRTRAAISYMRSVERALDRDGVPTIYVQPLATSVRLALERALLMSENRFNEAAQLVVMLVQIALPPADGSTRAQQLDLAASSFLLDVGEEIAAALLPLGDGLYAFYTTKAGLDQMPDWALGELPFLQRTVDVLGIDPKVGIGFGGTSKEAQSGAMRALSLAREVSGASAFAVLRDASVLGPLSSRSAAVRQTRVHDPDLVQEARKLRVATRSLAQVYSYLASFQTIDAEKLARLLGVSDRSARRTVNRLVEVGLLQSAGEESVHRRGRPRQLYRLAPPGTDAAEPYDGLEAHS
jgi:hypothetical protein